MNPLPQPGQFIGPYQVVEKLGQGGMGAVYKASMGSKFYAVKVLVAPTEEDLLRFQREAQALAQVDRHPNIVRVHSYSDSPVSHIVQSFVEGQSLGGFLREKGPLNEEESVRLGMKVASALAHIHRCGILHRDLKPENILIRGSDSEYLVTDFGLARAESAESLTQTGELLGTPAYMAPEQWEGEKENLGPWTDVWALGIMLYECCTGERPFQSGELVALARQVLVQEIKDPREWNPNLSAAFVSVLFKAVEKNRKDRYQSAEEMFADLERCALGEAFQVEGSSALSRSLRGVARRLGAKSRVLIVLAFLTMGSLIVAQFMDLFEDPVLVEARAKGIELERWSRELLLSSELIRRELKLVSSGAEPDHGDWREFKGACEALGNGDFIAVEASLNSLAAGKKRRFRELAKLGVFVVSVEKKDWQDSLFQLAELPGEVLTKRQRNLLNRALLRVQTMELLFDLSVSPKRVGTSFDQLVQCVNVGEESAQEFWGEWNKDVGDQLVALNIKESEWLQIVQRIEALKSGAALAPESLKLRLKVIQSLRKVSRGQAFHRYIDYLDLTYKKGIQGYDWDFIEYLRTTGALLKENASELELARMYRAVLVLAKCGFYIEDLRRFLQLLDASGLFSRYEGNPYNSFYRSSLIITDDLFPSGVRYSRSEERNRQRKLESKYRELNKALANKNLNELFRALLCEVRGHLVAVYYQRLKISREDAKRLSGEDYERALRGPHPRPDKLQLNYAREATLELSVVERKRFLKRALRSLEDRHERSEVKSLMMERPGFTYLFCSYREYLRRKSDIYRLLSELELEPGGNKKAALSYAKLALNTVEGRRVRYLVVKSLRVLKRQADFEKALPEFVKRYPQVGGRLFHDDPEALKIIVACLLQNGNFEEARFALNALQKLDLGAAKILRERLRAALEK